MKILIAYDGSIYSDAAIEDLRWAGLPSHAQAVILSAVEWPLHAPRTWGMLETGFGDEWLERVEAARHLAGVAYKSVQQHFPKWEIELETPTGNAAAVIVDKANTWPADLIVMGTHGRSGFARVVLGSVSLGVIRRAPCAVRVARPRRDEGPIRLLIGHDGSPQADEVVKEVCGRFWPAGTEARVLAVHDVLVPVSEERIAIGEQVYEQLNEDEYFRLRHAAKEAAVKLERAGLAVSSVVEQGEPKDILVREARTWSADTLFVGARGLGQVERLFLGSVSSASVTHAPCTVEVVHHR